MTRVASFVPTGTEWMYAMGLQDRLVSVTYACDVPAQAKREKPVSVLLRQGGGYLLDEDALRAARPDVLLTQSLCDECAPSHAQVAQARDALGYAPRLVSLDPTRLDEIPDHARLIARETGAPGAGDALARDIAARIDAVRRAVAGRPRPRAVLLEWARPPMAAGHWIPDILDAAGVHDPLGAPGGKSRVISWDDVHAARPHAILVAPCGVDIEGAVVAARAVAAEFPHTPVIAFDGARYFARSGLSVAAAVEMVAHALHPDVVARDADPAGWRRVDG